MTLFVSLYEDIAHIPKAFIAQLVYIPVSQLTVTE